MIGPPAGTRIWIAAGVTDLRRGFYGTQRDGADGASPKSIFGPRLRLAASGTQLRSANGGVKEKIFAIFRRVFIML
jgi:hypothetical protein